jgi:hypothetical protein
LTDLCKVAECNQPVKNRGWCNAHYLRWQRHGDPLGGGVRRDGTIIKWLREALNYKGSDCLIWPFARNSVNGYPVAYVDGAVLLVSRHICILAHGEPPPRNVARHSCGNGKGGCVNPNHLMWGTKKEDVQDAIDAGTFPRGETSGMSKLTSEDVLKIRALKGKFIHRTIGKMFGVSRRQIGRILSRTDWAWLP